MPNTISTEKFSKRTSSRRKDVLIVTYFFTSFFAGSGNFSSRKWSNKATMWIPYKASLFHIVQGLRNLVMGSCRTALVYEPRLLGTCLCYLIGSFDKESESSQFSYHELMRRKKWLSFFELLFPPLSGPVLFVPEGWCARVYLTKSGL